MKKEVEHAGVVSECVCAATERLVGWSLQPNDTRQVGKDDDAVKENHKAPLGTNNTASWAAFVHRMGAT